MKNPFRRKTKPKSRIVPSIERLRPGDIVMIEGKPYRCRLISSANYGYDYNSGTEIVFESV